MVDEIQIASKAGFRAGRKFQRKVTTSKEQTKSNKTLTTGIKKLLKQRRKAPSTEAIREFIAGKPVRTKKTLVKPTGFFHFDDKTRIL